MSPIFLIGAGIVLLGVGLGLGYLFANSQRVRETNRASTIQKELDDYRRDVSRHFGDTAQHFQAIGQQYQALYKHMADGAESLCDTSESDKLPGFTPNGVPALAVSEAEVVPEVIRDYAPEEELDLEPVEMAIEVAGAEDDVIEEAAITDDPAEQVIAAADTADETAENDVVAEPIAATDSAETERTVH